MNRKIFMTLSFAGALLALVSCGNKKASSEAEAPVEQKATLVSVAPATIEKVAQAETYTSTVEAYAINNIAPQTGGRIVRINVEIGNFVSRGQVLAVMDDSQLEQARIKLVNDSTELSRLRNLFEEGGVSKSDLDATEMAYRVSRRSYDNLVENTYLRSPISGVVSARNYDKGDMYGGNPIYVVQQITPVKLLVGISEVDYTKVKVGDEVKIVADALPGRTFIGKINRLYPTVNAVTHTFNVEVVVSNGDRALRPGMFCKATVEFGENDSIVVPDGAIVKQQGSGQRSVFVVEDDNTVSSRFVTLGKHFDSKYEVLEGLDEGEVVVVKGGSSLRNGDPVEIQK